MATALTKKQISNIYKNRNETSEPNAEKYFCDSSILSAVSEKTSESLKLCTYFLLEKLGAEKAWQLIKEVVVIGKLKQKAYENIGTVIRKSYKDASKANPAEGIVTRTDIVEQIYRPLMEHCILVKREHAKKFCWILQKATFDRDEPMAQMLFDVSTPIVWRYLKAANLNVRMGAYFVQVNVFPPSTRDEIRITDYMNEHCIAFLQALDDNSVEICIQAINNVSEAVSTYYDQIPKTYIEKIFNKFAALAKDDSNEVRAAVFHGIRFFFGCAKAVKNFETLLKHICPEAIDDSTDRVRCNVFRLLNVVRNSRIKVILPPKSESEEQPLLDLSDVLYRLDYETSEGVEREIVSLIYNSLFKKNMNSEERYKILNNMCRMNRSACLDLHRLLHAVNDKDTDGVMAHMSSILTVCSKVFSKIVLLYGNLNEDEANSTCQNDTVNDTRNQTTTNGVTSETLNKRLEACMNVVDCMVVCFASMRYDPAFDYTTAQAVTVTRYLSEIASEIISKFESRKNLVDTAFSIISLIRSAGMQASKLKNDCARMLRVGRLNKRYLEIYGLIDMSELMELLKKGLHQLENELFATENTPVRKKPKQSNKSKLSDIAVEALLTLLNLPSCTQYIVEKHMHYITGFIEQFERICSSCIANLQNEHSVNLQVFFSCWKIWTVMSIMKFNESAYKSTDDKQKKPLNIVKDSRRRSAIIKSEIEFDRVTDPMLKECCWMQHHINDCRELSANSDLVEHFYNMISLHLKSYKHFKSAIQSVIDYVKELHKMQEEFPRTRSINQPYQTVLKAGEHAMEYAESDFVIMQPVE